MPPLNDRLRFLTPAGRKNVPVIAAAIETRADFLSNPDRYSRSMWADEFSTFSRMDWLRIAAQEITAQVDGEMQRYEMQALSRMTKTTTLIAAE